MATVARQVFFPTSGKASFPVSQSLADYLGLNSAFVQVGMTQGKGRDSKRIFEGWFNQARKMNHVGSLSPPPSPFSRDASYFLT